MSALVMEKAVYLPRHILALLAGGLEEDAYFGELLVLIAANVSLWSWDRMQSVSRAYLWAYTLIMR